MKHLLLQPAAGKQHRTVKPFFASRFFSSIPFYACCLLTTFLFATGFTYYKKWWASTYSNVSTSSFPTTPFTGRVVTGDFDKDGDDDILYQAGTDGSAIMFAASNGNGTFAGAVPQSASPFRNVAAFNLITASTHVKDIDGDGDDDMYIAIGNSTGIYLRNDNGTFSSQSTATFPQPQFPGRVVSGDFNKDGDIDFLYQTGANGSPFNYASNNGNGTFSIGAASSAMFTNVTLADMTTELTIVADFDKDGDQDIWVPVGNTTGRYYRNDGAQYSEPSSAGFPAPQFPGRVKVADYDFDGDPDILYQTGVDGSAFGYYQNNGNATFTNVGIAGSPLNGLSLPNLLGSNYNIVDFDADGDIDIYTTVNSTQGSYFVQQSQVAAPPSIQVPATISVTEDVASPITSISASDPDAGTAPVTVSFSVPSGTLTATSGSGVTVTGSNTDSIALIGAITDINAFIAASYVKYTTALNATADVPMLVSHTENAGLGNPRTVRLVVTLDVSPVNDAPVAMRDQSTTNENQPVTGNVLSNDTDIEGNALTASLVTAPVNGTVVLNANGSFTYTPNNNYSGKDSLTYQVCDNGTPSLCDTANLVFTVNAINNAPIAVRDQVNITEDVPATGNVLTNDSDPESNALTASLVTAPVNGTVVLNADGSFTYTPNANYNGQDSLIYQVCDNGTPSLCDTATLVFTVTSVNDAPIAIRDQVNVNEDIPATGNVLTNDTDPEGNGLTASLVTAPVNGTVVLNADGSFTYTPNGNYNGLDSLVYQVCDNGTPSLCDTATLLFTVNAVNDAPIAVRDQSTTNENQSATGNVLTNDSDPEGNGLTASLVTAPVNGTVVLNADGSFTYTPNANYNGKDSLIYQVCDNGTPSLCDTATLVFTINAVNDAPIAVRDQVTVTEDVPATGNVLTNDSDPEGNALTASLVTAPVNGTVVLNADGSFTYTPNANYSGKDSLTYQVCDNGTPSLCDTANLVFTVNAVNDAPIAVRDQATTDEDNPVTGNVLTNDTDPENNALTASLVTAPVNGTVVLNADGSFTYTPNAAYFGKDSLIYQVCDNGTPSLCDTATLVFTIISVNDAPVAVNDNATLNANSTYTGNVLTNDNDPDGDALTASVVTAPKNGTVVLNPNGSFTYTPALNYSGKDSLIYKTCDSGTPSLCDTAQINFTVIDNIPPAVNIASSAEDTLNTPFSIAITFSENVNNFTQADITVTNATLSGFTAIDGKTYTAIIRPQATGTATVQIKAGVATDAAGNPNTPSGILARYFDITKPKVTITAPPTTRDVYTATISFSENVIDFDTSDILVSNGHILSMQQQGPRVYQVQIEPLIVGPVTLQVKAGTAQDPYGNPNEASNTATTQGIQSGFVDKIFPVPTSRFLYVQFKKIMTEKVAIRIVSSSGVIWYNRELPVVNHQITADLGNLPKGVYYLSLRSNWFRYKHTIMVVD